MRYAVPLGPATSEEDEEAVGAGRSMWTAASCAHSWRGSCVTSISDSTFTFTSASSMTNSTEEASDSLTSRFVGRSGARGRRTASASRERRGGRKVDWRGGAEQWLSRSCSLPLYIVVSEERVDVHLRRLSDMKEFMPFPRSSFS